MGHKMQIAVKLLITQIYVPDGDSATKNAYISGTDRENGGTVKVSVPLHQIGDVKPLLDYSITGTVKGGISQKGGFYLAAERVTIAAL